MSSKTFAVLLTIILLGLLLSLAVQAEGAAPHLAQSTSDLADSLLIGTPFEDLHGVSDAGSFNLVPGIEGSGLHTDLASLWTQDVLSGQVETNDRFATVLVSGDFNGDGFFDVAVGNPYEDYDLLGLTLAQDAGSVSVIYGNADGLDAGHQRLITQDDVSSLHNFDGNDRAENDLFGYALAAGDFDGDGYDDLVIGSPGEDLDFGEMFTDTGAVDVFWGSSAGLVDEGYLIGYGDRNEQFGYALAAGDFNGDGYDDLAAGAPYASFMGGTTWVSEAGLLYVGYGGRNGLESIVDWDIWTQGGPRNEIGDHFGAVLVVGNFNGDDYDDLVIGTPDEDTITSGGSQTQDAGTIYIMYGSVTEGLSGSGSEQWWQDSILNSSGDPVDASEAGDRFGRSLAVGDFDGDGADDLLVGIPYEDREGSLWPDDHGAVQLLMGSSAGIDPTVEIWYGGLSNERFGWSLAAGDFNHNGYADFVAGVPGYGGSYENMGAVQLFYSQGVGFLDSSRITSADIPGTSPEKDDQLGWSLGILPAPLKHLYLPLVMYRQ